MTERTGLDRRDFGAAFPLPDGFGRLALIFYQRVEELAVSKGTSEGLLLGHIIAHEIGHLLLGVKSHSSVGLMRVPWNRSQLERAYHGSLLFNRKESRRIRRQAFARADATRSQEANRSRERSPAEDAAVLAHR